MKLPRMSWRELAARFDLQAFKLRREAERIRATIGDRPVTKSAELSQVVAHLGIAAEHLSSVAASLRLAAGD